MPIVIPQIDLAFGDFALLAILLALMYGLTGMELAISLPKKDVGYGAQDRRLAAAWAFTGILATLVAGVVAAAGLGVAEPVLVLVPLFFVGRWAYFHAASASLINLKAVQELLHDHYKQAVLASVSTDPRTVEEIFALAVGKVSVAKLLEQGYGIVGRTVPVQAKTFVEDLLFTPAQVTAMLSSLATERKVEYKEHAEGRRYRGAGLILPLPNKT